MEIDRSIQVLKAPLVLWVRTFTATALADLTDLVDGYALNKIMTEIDPTFFGMTFVHSNVFGDINLRIHNLEHLLRSLKNYYKEKLQQVIVMDTPDVFVMANDPESDESIEELNRILLLILGCAVQCERKEFFIEKITTMNESIQEELVVHIREITEKFDKVFSFQPSEVAALSHDDLLSYCEHMYDQMILLVNQRDATAEEMHQLLADRSFMSKEVDGNVSRVSSPPLSPTNSEFILAEKAKLRKATEELEEKNLLIQELRDELESNKVTLEKLLQENKSLSETSRFVNAYRDQLDVLKIKAEKVNKLENEILKYKEKLMDMDVLKKRKEELEEQNEILYNTKVVLEKQINTLNPKADKLVEKEREVARLKRDLKGVIEEKKALQTRNKHLLDENAVLLLDAQNSLSEVSILNSELNMMKGKEDAGEGTCLANEYNQISSTQLLKLENENHRLKVMIAELTQHKTTAVPQTIVPEEEMQNEAYEQTTEHVDGVSDEAEVRVVERQSSMRKTLPGKELSAVREKLKQKEEFANKISESLSTMEQENSELQDRIQQVTNQKRRSDQLIQRKNEDVTELERRLEEVTAERQKCETTLRQKSREINELTNSLSELKEDKERSVEAAEKKTKDLHELKERMDVLLSEKENLGDNLTTKDKKLVDLENRLQRIQEANRELAETLESQRDKITSQEKRVAEVMSSSKEQERKYSETIREKDRRVKEFERRMSQLIEVESELERLNYQLKQKDRKSDGFLKTIEEKDQEIVQLENRLEDANSTNNKLVYNFELRDKKVESLEQRLHKAESKAEKQESNEDRARREILETKDDKILELESRLEDALTNCKKLQHTLKVKDEKIVSLETRLEEAHVFELDCNKMTKSLDEKKMRIAQLESSLDEVSGESHKLSCDLQLKETKVKDLEERVRILESEKQENEAIRRTLKEKEDNAVFLGEKLRSCMEELAVLENRIEEANSQNRKLQHSVKMKEERIVNLETSVLELEEITSHNQIMKQMIQQKEEKIRAMEQKVDEYEEASRQCERLTQKLTDQEERTTVLNNRISELEEHENNNKRLKLMVTQKDDRIKYLEQSLQETQLKCTNLENEIAKVHSKYEEKVKRSLEDVDTHRIRRNESVRRREEQINSLEKSRSKLETVLHAQEGHIQSLQDRLEGSVSERNKLGTTISKKEAIINQLETKILELEESTGETKKLSELIKKKDETIKRYEDRVREVELLLARTKTTNREKDEKIDALQKRIDECSEQNKKLDSKLKKKEEALKNSARDLDEVENRERELENSLERKSKNLEERNSRILELEASLDERNSLTIKQSEESLLQSPRNSTSPSIDANKIQTLKQKLWDAEARIEETENEKGKLQHQIKRKESQLQDLEQRLHESSDALEENERLKQTIKHKEERVRILQVSLDQNQQEINSLESRLESTTSEVYKLRKVDGEKQKRINSFKMKLEDTGHGVHEMITQKKDEKIQSLEEKNDELEQEKINLNKRLTALEAEVEKVRGKKGSAETIIVNTSPRRRPDVACVIIDNGGNLETKYEDLEKECEKLRLNKERTEGRYTSLKEENKSLTQELDTVNSDYDQLLSALNELKESYTELDLSSAKSLHRCEMLTQMNSTLEEENRMLMEQMNKLLTQNQELLTESLVSRDQFLEEERTFSDRLYELQRQKEKLEEKIEQANKSLAENTPKKKSNLFKRVLQKAGLKKKKDEELKSKSAVQLIKYDQSPSTSAEGSPDMSVDSGPGIHGLFPISPERASDSSNFSESLNSEHSPEHDLSPLARRRARVNRAHRQRIVRSEYFTPAMANSLAMQGRSRSLDAKEFVRELIQGQGPDASPGQVSSSSSMTVLHQPSPSGSGDSGRERKLSNDVSRTLSFSRARDESGRLSPAHVRRKSAESRFRKPPDYKPVEVNGENSPLVRKKSGSTKVETRNLTSENSPPIKEKSGNFKVEASQLAEVNGENSPLVRKKSGSTKVETRNLTSENSPLTKEKSGNFKVEANQLAEVNGGNVPLTRKKSPDTKVEVGQRAEINEENFPFIKKKSVNTKLEATPENSPIWKKSVNNNVEATPELPIWEDRISRSSHHDDSSSSSRRVSESSRKSSDVGSLHSRTSSITESDTSKTTVRHVGSTSSASGGERVEKRHGVNGGASKDTDELQRLSSGSSDSVGNEGQKRSSRLYTPPPPHTTRPSDTPTKEPPPFPDKPKEKPQTKRSSSFAERPHSPSLARNQIQRQNSDRVLVSSLEIERRNLSHTKPIPASPSGERPRRPLSVGQRPDSVQKTGQSIGIVSFKEVARVQSAVLESSPQLERKERVIDLEEKTSGQAGSEPKLKETAHRGPQTPKSLRRTSKVENLAPKNDRGSEKPGLWYEYGQV